MKHIHHLKTKVLAASAVAAAALAPAMSYALTWPPTAAELTTAFTDMGDDIGTMIAAVAGVALIIYAGVIGIKAAFDWFGKFYKASKSAA